MSGGFRLHRLEVLNWGTFDGRDGVHSVRPEGATTLLIGQNGSGKSTLVDALLTLLVKPGVRNFNVAAGGKKRERDERTYIKGAYDRNSQDSDDGIHVKFLRPKGDRPTVILACFRNQANGKAFTLAQLLYLTPDQRVEKVYCYADAECSIAEHFAGLDSTDGIVKQLRKRGLSATKTFIEAERWFRRATGVKAKAMEVFNQTVAVKDIQRLNDFIRNHMLEQKNWEDKVDRLLIHFTQLSEAHSTLVKVREQSELLEPVAAIGQEFTKHSKDFELAERTQAAADAFFSYKAVELYTPERERLCLRLDSVRAEKDRLGTSIEDLAERKRRVQNEVENAGGERLRQIPLLIDRERAVAEAKKQRHFDYHRARGEAGISLAADNERDFADLRQRIPDLRSEVVGSIAERDDARGEVLFERTEVRRAIARERAEVQLLSKRRDNLPNWCVALRSQICGELRVPEEDLLFVAELVAVKTEERAWEAAIESVLERFGLTLLVPERLYSTVRDYIDATKLADEHGRGYRLSYARVDQRAGNDLEIEAGSLISKLDFRTGHDLLPWVQAELERRFDFRCCETTEEFRGATGSAMTLSRHVKSGHRATNHSKDDREVAANPRNFVLGWDNREKCRRIAQAVNALEEKEQDLSARVKALDGELAALRGQMSAFEEVVRPASFSEIDFSSHEREIAALHAERDALENASDAIGQLKKRLAETATREKATRAKRDGLVAEERELENLIAEADRHMAKARTDQQRYESEGELAEHRSYFEELERHFEHELTVENLFDSRTSFRRSQGTRVGKLRSLVEPIRRQLTHAMNQFLRRFPEEEADLRGETDYLGSFLGLRDRILADDLPRHERRFKDRLNEKVIQEIAIFNSELGQELKSIQDKISTLNESLRRLEYRPGHRIELQPRPVRDAEISDFRQRLRDCIEGSFEDSAPANEAKFLRIQELVKRLRDDSNRRWREKVTDVRRWLDFVANVVEIETERRVSSYDDSTGQSGGEKAKLAFTILVAAIAYQYDLSAESDDSDRFRFVVVDEMFSKVDDQHAEYALELFKQFELQLLIVTPLDAKARVTQPYVGRYLHVSKRNNLSEIFEMTAREFVETFDKASTGL